MGVTTGGQTPAIELRDIVKRFPGVVANDGVNLTVMPGTIHAIVGENGAGKSTLMKILYGAQPADEGRILVGGIEQHFRSPRDAIAIGIGMVFQHFMLADNLTVWENIILGDEPGTSWRLDINAARKRIVELGRNYGLRVDPAVPIFTYQDNWGTQVDVFDIPQRHTELVVTASARVETMAPALPISGPFAGTADMTYIEDGWLFLQPTRHTRWSESITDAAKEAMGASTDVVEIARSVQDLVHQ